MLDQKIAENIISKGLNLGADFVDIFVEKNFNNAIRLLKSKVSDIQNGIDFGVGVRLIFGTKVVYGYSNSINEDELLKLTSILSLQDRKQASIAAIKLSQQEIINNHKVVNGLDSNIGFDQKINYLLELDKYSRKQSSYIEEVDCKLFQRLQKIQIFNSNGLMIKDRRDYIRTNLSVIARKNGEQTMGYSAPGGMGGYESLDLNEAYNPKLLATEAASTAIINLSAQNCPAGKMPVIIDSGFGGVIFHEACGHALETTSVQKKSSVFWDKKGEMIASECVSAVDDGTIENHWGSLNVDDEGMPTQKTQLIKNGKLENFLCDYVGSLKTSNPRTGSGRKESYKFAPASRMRNTYIEAGNDSLDDMIKSIDYGIYAKKMGGGSVQPGTGEFNFASLEAYLIKNGKVLHPLKNATLIGNGAEVLKKITMVGTNLALMAGVCGSVSGMIPTTVGQPAIKVSEILVGGQSV